MIHEQWMLDKAKKAMRKKLVQQDQDPPPGGLNGLADLCATPPPPAWPCLDRQPDVSGGWVW